MLRLVSEHTQDGDVFIETSPEHGSVVDHGSGHKGFWLSVAWSPEAESKSGGQPWKARIIEEVDGRVVMRPLDPERLREVCSSGKLGLAWLSVVILSSEMARLQDDNRDLRRRLARLENRSFTFRIFSLFKRLFGSRVR